MASITGKREWIDCQCGSKTLTHKTVRTVGCTWCEVALVEMLPLRVVTALVRKGLLLEDRPAPARQRGGPDPVQTLHFTCLAATRGSHLN